MQIASRFGKLIQELLGITAVRRWGLKLEKRYQYTLPHGLDFSLPK